MKIRILLGLLLVVLFTAGSADKAQAQWRHGYRHGYYHRGPSVSVRVGPGYYPRHRYYGPRHYGYYGRPAYRRHYYGGGPRYRGYYGRPGYRHHYYHRRW